MQNVQDVADSLSPKDFASALGVSESSVKRWVDDGRIRALRTPGGHRRIAVGEAIRFVRSTSSPLVRPDLLGIRELRGHRAIAATSSDFVALTEALHTALTEGRALDARALILQSFLAGASVAELCDGPLRSALTRIGDLWQHDRAGVFVEHRATAIVIEVLSRLRTLIAVDDDAPRAVGCAPSGDPYVVPTLAVAAVLAGEGFDVTNLGPETPMPSLTLAVERVRPRIAWISASTAAGADGIEGGVASVVGAVGEVGGSLVIGGRAFEEAGRRVPPGGFLCRSISELAAFARGLQSIAGDLHLGRGAEVRGADS